MGSKIEYVDSSQIYATTYVRNSKAIGVLWAIFTICYAIIVVVTYVTPEWIGNVEGERPAKFGLWLTCYADDDQQCVGKFHEFYKTKNLHFLIASVCVGISVITAVLTIVTMFFFFFCDSTNVYHVCGWLQLVSGKCKFDPMAPPS